MVKASGKVRAYLRAHGEKAVTSKKIAVCGKGGTGKSTVTTLLANILLEDGFSVLILDTDESNPGLYRMFGFEKQPAPLITLLKRFSTGEHKTISEWLSRDKISVR